MQARLKFYEIYEQSVYDLLKKDPHNNLYRKDDRGMLGGVVPVDGGMTPGVHHMKQISEFEVGT